jgi:uncharacterized protein
MIHSPKAQCLFHHKTRFASMKHALLLLVSVLLLGQVSPAQKKPPVKKNVTRNFVLGITHNIYSAQLKEQRVLNIYLPDGYSPDSATRYPVLYLLDGSAHEDFIHIAGIVQFLNMIGDLPKIIVVGIANVDRKRDFTFPTTVAADKKDFPTTGGSAAFIAFMEKELQPFIQKQYKTTDDKMIIGQSLGGLLATEILLTKPQLFNQYMIVSPSLWWDNESLLEKAPALLKKQQDKNRQVYIAVGTEGDIMVNDAKKLHQLLEADNKTGAPLHFLLLPEEDHRTILHNSIYKGFQRLYPPAPAPKLP